MNAGEMHCILTVTTPVSLEVDPSRIALNYTPPTPSWNIWPPISGLSKLIVT